jgi:spoIIIJ-associated protein
MTKKRASLEVIAPSVEEAIDKGLADLGLTEEAVEVEVLDEGSKGLFGLGSRQARVRLTIKAEPGVKGTVEQAEEEIPEEDAGAEPDVVATIETAEPEEMEEPVPPQELDEVQELVLHVARETVVELLEHMGVFAEVTARYGEADDTRSRVPVMIDVNGKDLSILIGPQAETLNALQYITHLIVGKELGRSIPLVVDVEGYRQRRAQAIRRMARSMAEQAVKTGRRQVLEPMPASERRLVHIELREHPDVYTESVGEDPRRKVTIIPKEE